MKNFNGYPLDVKVDIIYNKNSLDSVIAAKVLNNYLIFNGRLPELISLDNYGYFNIELKNDSFILGFNKFKTSDKNLNVYYISPYLNGNTLSGGNNCIEMLENFLNINIYVEHGKSNDDPVRYNKLLDIIYNMDYFSKKTNNTILDIITCQDISDDIQVKGNNYYVSTINQNIEKRYNFPHVYYIDMKDNDYSYKVAVGTELNNYDYLKLNSNIDGMVSFNLSTNGDTCVKVFAKSIEVSRVIKNYFEKLGCIDKYGTLNDSSHGYMLLDLNIKKLLSILA